MRLNLAGPSYENLSLNADAQRSVNLYPEIVESGTGKARVILHGTPGLSTFATLPTGPVRGLWAGENRLFAAGGAKLYEVSSTGTPTEIGTIANDGVNSPVQMFPNGTQLFVVSAGQAYVHNGSSLSAAPVPAAPDGAGAAGMVNTAKTGCFLDGYFIAAKPDSKVFFVSALNDGSTWDELDFASKEAYPDNILSIVADHQELWLFGSHKSIEGWRNEGGADFPFRRDPSAFIHQAIVAPWSALSFAGGLAWLGGDTRGRSVAYVANGFMPKRISTHAIEAKWETYSSVADCYTYAYSDKGHDFLVFNFLSGNATWVYDATTQLWHERAYLNGSTLEKHRGRNHAFVFNRHLVGDHTTGVIHHMSTGTYTDGGAAIHRIRTVPHVSNEQKRVAWNSVQLDLEIDGSGNPDVAFDYSDDGGHTYSTAKTISPSLASRKGRCIWRRLGSARDRVCRFKVTEAVKVAMIDAFAEVTPGVS